MCYITCFCRGVELSKESMSDDKRECPDCKSTNIELVPYKKTFDGHAYINRCKECGRRFS